MQHLDVFGMHLPTKIKAQSCMTLEELPIGFGLHICSFLHQQSHMVKAPSLYGDVQGCLTCRLSKCFIVTGNKLQAG